MLYLVTPDGRMSWAATDGSAADADPRVLDWTPAEGQADDTIVRIALRRGSAVYGGIVVDGAAISGHHLSRRLADTRDDARGARERMRHAYDELERRSAGARAAREAQDARRDHEAGAALGRSRSDVIESLDEVEADPGLVKHWRSVGGAVPHPL